MKKLMIVFSVLLFAVPAFGSAAILSWDAAPAGETWEEVRVYEVVDSVPIRIMTVPGAQTTATIQDVTAGPHSYLVRSYVAPWESDDSNIVSTGSKPSVPGNLRIEVIASAGQ